MTRSGAAPISARAIGATSAKLGPTDMRNTPVSLTQQRRSPSRSRARSRRKPGCPTPSFAGNRPKWASVKSTFSFASVGISSAVSQPGVRKSSCQPISAQRPRKRQKILDRRVRRHVAQVGLVARIAPGRAEHVKVAVAAGGRRLEIGIAFSVRHAVLHSTLRNHPERRALEGTVMKRGRIGELDFAGTAGRILSAALGAVAFFGPAAAQPAGDLPLSIAREGFFYVGGKFTAVGGRQTMTGQMYVEVRLPAGKPHPYPIVMVHRGTMSGTNYTGTPDGREGWAQYFVRQGYAAYVVDQPGRGRSAYQAEVYGPAELVDRENSQRRYIAQEKYKLWPQAHLHTQWPGSGEPDDPIVRQLVASQLPAIRDFRQQQILNRDALVALLDRIGPAVLLVHSQAGAFGWPVADARTNLRKTLLAVLP